MIHRKYTDDVLISVHVIRPRRVSLDGKRLQRTRKIDQFTDELEFTKDHHNELYRISHIRCHIIKADNNFSKLFFIRF